MNCRSCWLGFRPLVVILFGIHACLVSVPDAHSQQPALVTPRATFKGGELIHNQVSFSPDGRLLASASVRGVILWDVSNKREAAVLPGPGRALTSIVFSPDGQLLVTGGNKVSLAFWDVRKRDRLGIVREPEKGIRCLVFSPDGKKLLGVDLDDTLIVWDVQTRKQLTTFDPPTSNCVNSLAISPDGKTVAAGSWEAVNLWDMSTGKVRTQITGYKGQILDVAFSPDGKTLAWTVGHDSKVVLWNVATQKAKRTIDFQGRNQSINRVRFSPDGKLLAVSGNSQRINLHDAGTGEERALLYGHDDLIGCIAFSPDGKTIAGGYFDGVVHLWDVPAKK